MKEDQVHAGFAAHLNSVAEKVVIVDYEPLSF